MGKKIVALVVLVATLFPADPPLAWSEEGDEEPSRRSVLLPLPIAFYTPETKFAGGFSASYLYRTSPELEESRASTIGGVAIYTARNQLVLALGGQHYFDADRQQLAGGVAYRNFPDEFFGLGNDTEAGESDSYTDEGYLIELDYTRQVWPQVWAGGGLTLGQSSIRDVEPGERLAAPSLPGARGAKVLGAVLVASYDSRSSTTYPRQGGLYELRGKFHGEVLGTDHRFTTISVDARKYLTLFGESVLAVRGYGVAGSGDVPFQLMPALGGDLLLRGYYGGRFRDRQLLAAQAELRGPLWKRLGYAAFGGMGQVAEDLDLLGSGRFHFSGGLGLRILLVPEETVNLRLDFGFGEDESGFYLGFGEVF